MVRLLPYYVIPVICALVGIAIGYLGSRSSRLIVSVVALIVMVLAAGVLEVSWHESIRLEGSHRLQVMLATALALAVVTLTSSASAWFAARRWKGPAQVVLVSGALSVPVLAAYPVVALFFLCYVGHDCI